MDNTVTVGGVDYEWINADVIEVRKDGKKLGDISPNEGDWEQIVAGSDPIADGWEDGNGHVLSLYGWGEQ